MVPYLKKATAEPCQKARVPRMIRRDWEMETAGEEEADGSVMRSSAPFPLPNIQGVKQARIREIPAEMANVSLQPILELK